MSRIHTVLLLNIFLLSMSSCFQKDKLEPHFLLKAQESQLLETYSSEIKKNEIARFEVKEKHFINLEAINDCGNGQIVEITKEKIECQYSESGSDFFQISVCDEKKSFCKLIGDRLSIDGKKDSPLFSWFQEDTTFHDFLAEKSTQDAHGFYKALSKDLLKKASKEKKFFLLDFSAVWCPPCMSLEDFVFDEAGFVKSTQELIKVKIDVDDPTNAKLLEKFNIQSYPTVILSNENLEALGRFSGFRSSPWIQDWIQSHRKLSPINTLKENTSNKEEALRLALWHQENSDYTSCLKQAEKLPSHELLRLECQLGKVRQDENKELEATTLKILVNQFPEHQDWIRWKSKQLKLSKTKANQKDIQNAEKSVETWVQKADQSTYEFYDFYFYLADFYETLEDSKNKKKALTKVIESIDAKMKEVAPKLPMGLLVNKIYVLKELDQDDSALQVLLELHKQDPQNYNVLYRLGRDYAALGKHREANEYFEKAYKMAKGTNRLRMANLWADTLKELDSQERAKSLLKNTLREAEVAQWKEHNSQYWVRKLRKKILSL